MGCSFAKYNEIGTNLNDADQNFTVLNSSRNGKKLLVLDLDETIGNFCTHSPVVRPHLHYFLEEMYKMYDIIIWSATKISIVEGKLDWLGLLRKRRYKIMCYIGINAMTTITFPASNKIMKTKGLEVIWKKFPEYNARNTILIDDKEKNFYLNEHNGLLIKKFEAGDYQTDDEELVLLMAYLSYIWTYCPNFMMLNHKQWRKSSYCDFSKYQRLM